MERLSLSGFDPSTLHDVLSFPNLAVLQLNGIEQDDTGDVSAL